MENILQYALDNLTFDYDHNLELLTNIFVDSVRVESMQKSHAERLQRMYMRCLQILDYQLWGLDISELNCKKYIVEDGWAGMIYIPEQEKWKRAYQMALEGDAKMSFLIGNMLRENRFSEALSKNASKFYKISAEHGSAQGMYELGMCYRWGDGGEFAEGDKAMYWFKEAAACGQKEARKLAERFGTDEGIKFLSLSALHGVEGEYCYWYKSKFMVEGFYQKANEGDAECQYELGRQLTPGIAYGAFRRSTQEAIRYYEMASKNGVIDAMFNLSNLYREGNIDLEPNPTLSFLWMKKCMEAGDIEAMFEVGKRLVEGEGTEVNHELGIKYINEAAERGLKRAEKYRCVL